MLEQKRNISIAYFCAEFAVDDDLPIFSGGLGVLAGDMLKQASEDKINMTGISLLYKKGYFHQAISRDGSQIENPEPIHSASESLTRVFDDSGKPLLITLPIENNQVNLKVWEYFKDGVKIFLLDSDHHENTEEDKLITENLYPSDPKTRIKQEIILGIGGEKMLQKLHIHPDIHHMNEGHSAFAIFELTHHIMKDNNIAFNEAIKIARKKLIFTNHTLLPSGNDMFDVELVRKLLSVYTQELGIGIEEVINMGNTQQGSLFTMTNFALTNSNISNTVSEAHYAIAKVTLPSVNLISITNGVHKKTWQGKTIAQVIGENSESININSLWLAHQSQKKQLIESLGLYIDSELNSDNLVITWARRIALYKRPDILLGDINRLKNILYSQQMPAYLIIAGKAHPDDESAKEVIKNINNTIMENNLEDRIFFLPDYSLTLARLLVGGSDVWLNTPEPGKEACGTSGMKSSLNGVLQCSINDGWVKELNWEKIGWILSDENTTEDLYNQLEKDIIPLYYTKENIESSEWADRMKRTILLVDDKFTTKRMLSDYFDKLYNPSLE